MIRKNDEDLLNWIWELVTDFEDEFDDSYNLKYKRTKAKRKSILKDLPYIGTIRSK